MNYYPIIIDETDDERPDKTPDAAVRSMADTFVVARPEPVTGTAPDTAAATGAVRYSPAPQAAIEPATPCLPAAFAAAGYTEMTATPGTPGQNAAISREEVLEMIDRKIATIRVEVVEADITRAQNTIKAIVEQSTY
ncbi:MAG: hypothetical protein IJC16_01255 [Rikenellaceae bacterium]|nr:hypothetical protein [Rikenellaceae bacterium]